MRFQLHLGFQPYLSDKLMLEPTVPHLQTALTGALYQLEQQLLDNQLVIESWFRGQWAKTTAPITCSVDIRNAGFKLSPVDTNLFPAGFNNLAEDTLPLAISAAQRMINKTSPDCQRILIIPESHTRNLFYLESLANLQNILIRAGFDTRIGSLIDNLSNTQTIELPSGRKIILDPLIRENNTLKIDGFTPCLIILNNDFSEGVPEILNNIEQPMRPPSNLGWHMRSKFTHFEYYQQFAKNLAEKINLDPWLMMPLMKNCGDVNFVNREGVACIEAKAEQLFEEIKDQYEKYNIKSDPFVVVKADQGTYGMSVIMLKSPSDIQTLNRKQRQKLSTAKGQQQVSKVLIQEGVPTVEVWGVDKNTAEPVVYMLGEQVIGGFYRVHSGRGASENLNAPGMVFEPLAFSQACNLPDPNAPPDNALNRFYAYGVIARLALLAAAEEKKELA